MNTQFHKLISVFTALFGMLISPNSFAAPSDRDLNFNGTGMVITGIGAKDEGFEVAVQNDGKIVFAGYASNGVDHDFAVLRYNGNGSLDASFNSTGKTITDFNGGNEHSNGLALQSDGKIVVAGSSFNRGIPYFALARYNTDGSLDASFGSTGKITTAFSGINAFCSGVGVQQDGKIVLVGWSYLGDDINFTVVRYNTDGVLDVSFNGSGIVSTDLGGFDYPSSLVIQGNGKIIVAGWSYSITTKNDFALARYNPDGSLDTSLNGTGKLITDFSGTGDYAQSVAVQRDGKIVLAGVSEVSGEGSQFALVRYNPDGTLDSTFNSSGKVTTPGTGLGEGMAIQSDGKIVMVGGSGQFQIARYNVDGSLDPTFNGTGKMAGIDAHSVAIQSGGQILVGGTLFYPESANSDFVLARYLGDGPQILSVSPNPVSGSNARQNFTINGTNFDPNCTVTLRDRRSGLVYPNRQKVAQTFASITLNPIFGAVSAAWSVELLNPGGGSSGEYVFSVAGPSNFPEITSTGISTITAGSTPQTLTLLGRDFAPNSTVRVRSMVTGEMIELATSVLDSTRAVFTSLFSHAGKWSVTIQRPDGQSSQPLTLTVVENTEFKLSFPLLAGDPDGHTSAYTAGVNTLFDHKMKMPLAATLDPNVRPLPDEPNDFGIVTFRGDECIIRGSFAVMAKGNRLYNFLPVPALLQTDFNYRYQRFEPVCAYDNHAGIDYYGTDGKTAVYAAADGVLEIVTRNSLTAGNWVQIKHDNHGYSTGYLHLNKFAPGLDIDATVVEGQYIGLVGGTGGVGPHLHFQAKDTTANRYVDPYGWSDLLKKDPYTILTGVVNKTLWRDQPKYSIYVFPIAFAGAPDPKLGQQVTNPAIPASGGQRDVLVNTYTDSYDASVSIGSDWLTISSGGSGSGLTMLTLGVAQNTGSKRSGKVIIQPKTGGQRVVTVKQEAAIGTSSSGFGARVTNANEKKIDALIEQIAMNPGNGEIAVELERAAAEYRIPTNILAAVAYVGSLWQQFNGGGNPFTGADGRIGIMQIDTHNPEVPMDTARVGVDWRYNIEIGCQILLHAWRNRLGDSLSPYDDENDADPAILENWFYPVAWQHGVGAEAYAFVGKVWSVIKSPQSPVSDYFGAVSDLGDPRWLAGFPTTIGSAIPEPAIQSLAMASPALLVASGKSTLMILRLLDQQIHRWNWDSIDSGAVSPVNITESIRTEPPKINYETWASYLDELSNGPLADIDGDGVVNLLECALGGDPDDANSSPSPIVRWNGTSLEMVATIATNIVGVEFDLESSSDCIHWTSTNILHAVILEDALSRTLKWAVPAIGPNHFIRLRVFATE